MSLVLLGGCSEVGGGSPPLPTGMMNGTAGTSTAPTNQNSVDADGVVVDVNGNPVTDDQGNPLRIADDPTMDPVNHPTPSTSGSLADCSTPGPRGLRRLTSLQYARTVQGIFGTPDVPVETVLSDAAVLGFHVDAKTSVVRDLEGELLMNYAESVADWAIENGRAAQFTSCTELQESCQRDFIARFGAKAHREPLSDATISTYQALFSGESSFEDGMRSVMSAMLQSPYTLYRRELGAQNGSEFQLSPYEVASELSYWLTDAPPDDALYAAAAEGRLVTAEDLSREASRLLETDYARESLAGFLEGWLHVDKLSSKAKDEALLPLPAALRDSMVQETKELFLHTFYENGSLSDLFTAKHTYIDQRLASHYELDAAGTGFERVDLTGTERPAGVLGHAAFLTTHALSDNSSPVQRAKVVIERLLCGQLPPVPSNLDTTLDDETQFSTNRERYAAHRENEACATCHDMMDPVGFAFEHFDGFGRYRDQENGVDIDATGSLTLLAAGAVALDGVDSLSEALAESPELESCLVRYWSYYAFGAEGWTNAECHRDGVVRQARADGFTLRSVLLGLARSPHFTRRVTEP